ncbi:MAG TPA: hypothetical protein VM285_02865 [Polyangia bacterium]|nr:hypothetical protein [Polyangia bacterium]
MKQSTWFFLFVSALAAGACSGDGKSAPTGGKEAAASAGHAALGAADPGVAASCKDAASGTTFEVEPDGRVLVAKSNAGKETFRLDVIAKCGTPAIGAPVIRHLAVQGSSLEITFGKHSSAALDLASMTLACKGSD